MDKNSQEVLDFLWSMPIAELSSLFASRIVGENIEIVKSSHGMLAVVEALSGYLTTSEECNMLAMAVRETADRVERDGVARCVLAEVRVH